MLDTILDKYLVEDGEAAVSGATTTDTVEKYAKPIGFKIQKRRKKKKKIEPVSEAAKALTMREIIDSLGGDTFLKKTFTTPGAAYNYIIKNINKILVTYGMSKNDIPLKSIEAHLRSIIKGK